jgi:PadR family transcriptional regulator PadR
MADPPSDLVQGTLEMLILKTLALEPMHGWDRGPARTDEQRRFPPQRRFFVCRLQRLRRNGLIRNDWKATENSRRAKHYARTEQRRKRLNSETREWGRQVPAIARILEAS